MNITIEAQSPDDMECHKERLKINGKVCYLVGPLAGCPEDAYIGRDLTSATEIAKLIQLGHEAGKSGEPFSLQIMEVAEL